MKIFWKISSLLLLFSPATYAQFTIGSDVMSSAPGTTIATNGDINLGARERSFGQLSWHLVGTEDQQVVGSTIATVFHQLYINGGSTKTFTGTFGIADELHLIDGLVSIPANQQFALSAPGVLQNGYGSQSFINGRLLINIGDNSRAIYPVGNGQNYTPVELSNISGSSPIIGIATNNSSIGTLSELPQNVNDYSQNWHWALSLASDDNTFNAANITIPFLDDDKSQFGSDDYKPLVLYQNSAGVTSNLDNASGDAASNTDPDITSLEMGGKGFYFAGKTLVFNPIVHNIITPNGDNSNDYLVIENLDFFPENEIMIVDRYGVEIYTKSNYVSPDATSAEGEDFTFLPPGNYICILKFITNNVENTIKQTISVIK
jgi:gliding motility-associated-like protein